MTGGATEGVKEDRENYVHLLNLLRSTIDASKLLTVTGAAGNWVLDVGFNLESIIKLVDFIHVMTYDYFGPWESKWGAYTGPNAPLYNAAPKGYSGKLNVDFTRRYYSCYTKSPEKLIMGVGFYGRKWENVLPTPVDGKDGLWRIAELGKNGKYEGSFSPFWEIKDQFEKRSDFQYVFHTGAKIPYLYSPSNRSFIAYENSESISEKVGYAKKNVM